MSILLLICYVLIALSIWIYDAVIGFGIELDGDRNPPLVLCMMFWPIFVPILIFVILSNFLSKIKIKRIYKEKEKAFLEKETLKEFEKAMKEIG